MQRLTDDLQSLPVGGAPGEATPSQPVWLDERQVLFHAIRGGGSGLYVIDSQQGSVEPVQTWQAQHGGFSTDAANRYVVQSRTSMTEIGNLYVFDNETNEGKVITNYNADLLARESSGSVGTVRYRAQRLHDRSVAAEACRL